MEAPRVIENIRVTPNPIQCPVHRVPTAILKAQLSFTALETVIISRLLGGLYACFHDESGVESDEEAFSLWPSSLMHRYLLGNVCQTFPTLPSLKVGKKELFFHEERYISWNTFPERLSTETTSWLISWCLQFSLWLNAPTPSFSASSSPFEVTTNEFAPLQWKSETVDIKTCWPLTFLPYAFHRNFKHHHDVPFTFIDNIKRLSRCPLALDISVHAAPYLAVGTKTRVSLSITLSNKRAKLNPTFLKLELVQFKNAEENGCWKINEYRCLPSNITAVIRDEFGVTDEQTTHVFRIIYFYEVEGKEDNFSFSIPIKILSRPIPVVGNILPSKETNDLIIYHQDTQLSRYRQIFVESIMGLPVQKSLSTRFDQMTSWVSNLLAGQSTATEDDSKTMESDEGIFTDSGSWVSISSYLLP